MSRTTGIVVALGAILAGMGGSALYTVDAREVAVVLAFGAPVRTVNEPGLRLKAPWPIHNVVRLDRRARVLDVSASELLTNDKKNLVVEAYAIWEVSDPRLFLESFRDPVQSVIRWSDLVESAETRLSDLVTSRIASALARREFTEFVTVAAETDDLLPDRVREDVAVTAAERFGIHVRDVRLRHLGLPIQNEQSIYERMRAERLRIANAYRSEGEEEATTIRAEADRKAAEVLAEADREAAVVLAEAETAAARLYAEVYREDPRFYSFLRSLDTVRTLVAGPEDQEDEVQTGKGGGETVLVLDSETAPFHLLTEELVSGGGRR